MPRSAVIFWTKGGERGVPEKESYKTIAHEGEAVIVEKKSRFIAAAAPVGTEEQALEFLQSRRSKYPDARHNVYAYVIAENNIFRYSDDGEPAGTAGMPVLDVIRKAGIVDCAIVVTRYFGGTLLGTGGLVRAYSESAAKAMADAAPVMRMLCDIVSIKTDYTTSGRLSHYFSQNGVMLENTIYDTGVTYLACVPVGEAERFLSDITELSNGQAHTECIGRKYTDKEEWKGAVL